MPMTEHESPLAPYPVGAGAKGPRQRLILVTPMLSTAARTAQKARDASPPASHSFEEMARWVFVVIDLSGSGKSTLVRCLTRLIEPTEGEVILDGERHPRRLRPEAARPAQAAHGDGLPALGYCRNAAGQRNVAYGLEIRRSVQKERRAHRGGPRPRRAVARELLPRPALRRHAAAGGFGPRAGGDPDCSCSTSRSSPGPAHQPGDAERGHRLQPDLQKTMVFITHDLSECIKLGDRILIMRDSESCRWAPDQVVGAPVTTCATSSASTPLPCADP